MDFSYNRNQHIADQLLGILCIQTENVHSLIEKSVLKRIRKPGTRFPSAIFQPIDNGSVGGGAIACFTGGRNTPSYYIKRNQVTAFGWQPKNEKGGVEPPKINVLRRITECVASGLRLFLLTLTVMKIDHCQVTSIGYGNNCLN